MLISLSLYFRLPLGMEERGHRCQTRECRDNGWACTIWGSSLLHTAGLQRAWVYVAPEVADQYGGVWFWKTRFTKLLLHGCPSKHVTYTKYTKTYSTHEGIIEISLTKVRFQSWHKISLSSVPGIKWRYNKFQLNVYLNFRLSDLNYNFSWQITHLFWLIPPSHCFGRSHSKLKFLP